MTSIMDVTGYVARFCTDAACAHDDSSPDCSNNVTSRFYIDPAERLNILDKPLVVTHNDRFIVGRCVMQASTSKGLLLKCRIDDAYFLESLRRRYDDFKENYNPAIPDFETYCKKTLSSFSLSHNNASKVVRHVSLVDTPGRLGTAVTYTMNPEVVLKRRLENEHISDIVASHSSAYTTQNDRRPYLVRNDQYSHTPSDLCYINAQRALLREDTSRSNMLSQQDQFNEAAEFFRWYKIMKEQFQSENNSCNKPTTTSLKRNRQQLNEDDGDDDSMGLVNKRGRHDGEVSASATRPAPSQTPTHEMMAEIMRDGVKQGITAAIQAIKQSGGLNEPPAAAAAPSVIPEPVTPAKQVEIIESEQQVEASRGRAAILLSPSDNDSLESIVKKIMGY